MSAIAQLPLLKIAAGVQIDEDFALSIAFYLSDGVTPINLNGISFSSKIGSIFVASSAAGSLNISGASGNVLSFSIPAAAKASWPPGAYALGLLATDGTYTRDVLANSTLAVGAPALDTVTVLTAPGASSTPVASSISAALAAALSGVASLVASQVATPVGASSALASPGIYTVTTTGVTLTLPTTGLASGSITIKDLTGSADPNITISATIDTNPSGLILTYPYQAVTLVWSAPQQTWVVI